MDINRIIHGDCIEEMRKFPISTFDLIFADPPFNIGKEYDGFSDDNHDYNHWTEDWIDATSHVLKENGSIYVAINDENAALIYKTLKDRGMCFRNWIIWYYTFGENQQKKFSRTHTHILYFTKDEKDFTFNGDDIRIPSERQKKYGDKRANPKGKIPDDVWKVPRVCGSHKERIKGFKCQMPEKILERIIKVSSNEGGMVLDPFCGTGTTAAVAEKLNRKWITIDISSNTCDVAMERIYGKTE